MKKIKFYRYVGRNGYITSKILLDDIKHYNYFHLIADNGKKLTNGELILSSAMVPEEEVSLWYEIDDN
jgi:phosphatidate phosphatase PAH1